MSRLTKIVAIVSCAVGLIAGAISGVSRGREGAAALIDAGCTSAQNELSVFSAVEFHYADSDHARQALLSEMRIGGILQRLSPRMLGAQTVYVPYARLALIEDAAGNTSASQAAFAKVKEIVREHHPKEEVTLEMLPQVLQRYDDTLGTMRY